MIEEIVEKRVSDEEKNRSSVIIQQQQNKIIELEAELALLKNA